MKKLIEHLEAMSLTHGATLKHPSTFHPMAIEHNAQSDFSRGVLATIYEIYDLASQTPDGRQAICDLGFQPLPQNVEGE